MPESLENQKPPLYMTASTKVPSLDEVTACHLGEVPDPPDGVVPVTSVQVAPVSVEKKRLPLYGAATCLTPSDDMVMPPPSRLVITHSAVVPVHSVQVLSTREHG